MTIQTSVHKARFIGDGVNTTFPFAFKTFQATDLQLTQTSVAGVDSPITSLFAIALNTDQEGAPGGTITYPTSGAPLAAGIVLTVVSVLAETQLTDLTNAGGFFPKTITDRFDYLTILIQQHSEKLGRVALGSVSDIAQNFSIGTALQRANKYLTFDANGNVALATALASGTLTRGNVGNVLYPILISEIGVVDTSYGYGNPRRFGCVGNAVADDTVGFQNCISCSYFVNFHPGDNYRVSTVTFSLNQQFVNFNGGQIVGNATAGSPQTCIVRIKGSFCTFVAYQVSNPGNGSTIASPNPNYQCATWWYNGTTIGSQYNVFFGMTHSTCQRALVYGALPGNSPVAGLQSENSIFGFRTIGCSNPTYNNAYAGFLHMSEPVFAVDASNWTVALPVTARAVENVNNNLFCQGGEIQTATTSLGFAADLSTCTLVGMNIETANPIQIVGDGVKISGGGINMDVAAISQFKVKGGVSGTLTLENVRFSRPSTLGSFDNTPMVDASSAGAPFTTLLTNCQSFEWRWLEVGANAKLVLGGTVVYKNHRLSITGTDLNIYQINSPGDSLLDGLGAAFDRLGYATTGWVFNLVGGGGSTLANTTNVGPSGFLASQLTMHATGNYATANIATRTSLATIQTSCLRCNPNELYWISCWLKVSSGTDARLGCEFFNLAGASIGFVFVADATAIGANVWSFVEGPLVPPAGAAYIDPTVYANTADVQITDLRIRRAN